MRLITLNGPMQCGKSWVVRNLKERFTDVAFIPVSFQDTLAKATQILLGVEHVPYEEFKKTVYHGRTGRQHMIDVATEKRRHDQVFFSRVLADRMRFVNTTSFVGRKHKLFIADSNGFPDELEFMRAQVDIDLLACSIEPADTVARGENYPGDSRFNLAHMCSVVATNSTLMLEAVSAALLRRGWA
ncbi:hypothetical protein EVC29_022 [Rhizobium phage RHph_Y52]|nr:hypothetical protein EVC16_022 [Rhizobium phage RHph_Y21]QIG76723.1 hypothetical protein EVC29_022 [Rhizobium phage RHph_Y52]